MKPKQYPELPLWVTRYVTVFGALKADELAQLAFIFCDHARFKDPFNDVQGLASIKAVFAHMYATLEQPRFEVWDVALSDNHPVAYLYWSFTASKKGKAFTIEGMSKVRFAAEGKAEEHIDYWDAGEHVYERVPVLKLIVQQIKKYLAAN